MKRIKTILSLIALAFIFSMNANAAVEYVFKEGINEVTPYTGFTATYTVQSTGKVEVATTEGMDKVSCGDRIYTYSWVPAASFPYTYSIDAKAGDVITIYRSFNMCTQVKITETGNKVIPIELFSVSPTTGKAFSWSTAGHVSVLFSKPVSVNDVVLKANGRSYPVSDINCNNGSLGFNITYALGDARANGLKDNEEFTVEVRGITDLHDATNLYNGNGILTLKYLAPSSQHNMVKATMNGKEFKDGIVSAVKFMSFYAAGGNDGIITVEFDDKVSAVGDCYISMGSVDQSPQGKYFRESFRPQIDGNKVTLDFRGVLRTLARMFPSISLDDIDPNDHFAAFDHEHMSLRIGNVKDSNGNPFYTSTQGNIGSFAFVFNYEEMIDDIVMDGDGIENREGSSKTDGSEVRLWIDQQAKSIDGVRLYIQVDNGNVDEDTQDVIYATGEVDIDKSAIKIISSDPDEGTVIGFTLPQLKAMVTEGGEVEDPQEKEYHAAKGTNIRLVLMVTTANGMPHDLVVNYIYNNATGIAEISDSNALNTNRAYNISGQRINPSTAKGIVIMNGKKTVVN